VRKPTTTPLSLLILGDPIVPLNAEEHIVSRFKSGIKREAFYFRGGKRVGVRRWWNDGTLAHEWATDGNDHHGRWVHFHTNGVPDLEASYRNGKRHGIRVQFVEMVGPSGPPSFGAVMVLISGFIVPLQARPRLEKNGRTRTTSFTDQNDGGHDGACTGRTSGSMDGNRAFFENGLSGEGCGGGCRSSGSMANRSPKLII
jgi:hypothetical protein